jgi:ribonuclease E
MPSYFGRAGNDIQESVGKKMARRDRPPIQRCLRRGDEIIVQIIKEGIGTKGPTLSTYLSIPGRILVMMPGMGKMGVSKKIEDEEERKRLRQILDSLKPPKGVGFIIRTAGIGKSKAEIQRDLTYLSRLWQQIEKKRESGPGAMELYTEGDLVTRTVRDVFASDVDHLIVDNEAVGKRVKEVIKITAPRTKNKVEIYDQPIPLFHKYGIERDIELMYSRHVPLPSGGSLVIDSTEAIVAIDVNSGKFRDHSDAEMTAFKTDMEAAEEIPRQLKLRDLGGVIICDFIDLRFERHRRELEQKLHDNLKNDRAKTKVLRMSQFGIIEMTRQRMRPSLKRSIYFDCPHCKGAGLVKTPESMALDVMRRLAMAVNDLKVSRVELTVCQDVAFYLQNRKRAELVQMEEHSKKRILIRSESNMGLDEMKLDLFDGRDGTVMIEGLNLAPAAPVYGRGSRGRGRGGRPDQRGGGQQQGGRPQPQQPAHHHDDDEEEDRFDADSIEDAVDEREHDQATGAATVNAALSAPIEEAEVPAEAAEEVGEAPAPIEDEEEAKPAKGRGRGSRGGRGRGKKATTKAGSKTSSKAEVEESSELAVVEKREVVEAEEVDEDDAEEAEAESNFEDVDDPMSGGSELLSRDNAAVGEDDRYDRNRRGRRGGRGGRGGGGGRDGGGDRNRQGGGDQQNRQGGGGDQNRQGGGQQNRGGGDQNRQGGRPQGGGGQQGGGHQQNRPQGGGQGGQRHQGGGGGGGGRHQQGRRHGGQNRGPVRPIVPIAKQPDDLHEEGDAIGNVAGLETHDPRGTGYGPGGQRVLPPLPSRPSGGGSHGGGGHGGGGFQGGPAAQGEEGEGGRRRRRRRGGRRHRRRRENAEARARDGGPLTGLPQDEDFVDDHGPSDGPTDDAVQQLPSPTESAPQPRAPRELAAEEPIVRTGSTDRHYERTETPVDPEPVRRPRSYRDLDAIPDDLD